MTKKYVGEKLKFTLLRNGEERTAEVTAEPRKYLIPAHEEQRGSTVPNYFVHAGLVFVGLNENYVNFIEASPIIGTYLMLGMQLTQECRLLTQLIRTILLQ